MTSLGNLTLKSAGWRAFPEFYRLSIAALAQPLISTGLVTAAETARLTARLDESDFTGCRFAFIGAWGMRR